MCPVVLLALAFAQFAMAPAWAASGDVDPAFDPNVNGDVYSAAIQPDGKILIGGGFTKIRGSLGEISQKYIARLNPDGTVDTGFAPVVNQGVYHVFVMPDGMIVIHGFFTKVAGNPSVNVAWLNPDGSPGKDPKAPADGSTPAAPASAAGSDAVREILTNPGWNLGELQNRLKANADVTFLASQADGKLIVGGHFTKIDHTPHLHIARFKADGTLDTGFKAQANGDVYCIAIQRDDAILAGGTFTRVNETPRQHLVRLSANGDLDSTFDPGANGNITAIAIQRDGRILLGGAFNRIAGASRRCLARLNADGTLDSGFSLESNGVIYEFIGQADGKIIIVGSFTRIANFTRNHIVRLLAE